MRESLNRVRIVVDKIRHIQDESSSKGKSQAKYITDRCNAIGKDEHDRLNVIVDKDTGALTSKPNCSHRYYAQLMEDYRNGVKALGFKHHAIDRNINGFIRKFSNKVQGLRENLNPDLPIEKLRENLIKLRANSVSGSEFRRELVKLRIEHHAYYMFEPKGAIKDWIRDDSKKQLNKKLHSQILVNPEWVVKIAEELLTKENPSVSELAIGIAMSTGRRLTEIMKTAELKAIDDKTLLFGGQLKTKNRHLFEELTSYHIPSLVQAKKVVKALSVLRKATSKESLSFLDVVGHEVESTVGKGDKKDYYHNRAVQKKYESTVNRSVRSIMGSGGFSIKTCRALYTEVTYQDHHKPGETRSAYRHRVLGHSQIETQLYYDAFKLDSSIKSIEALEVDKGPINKGSQQHLLDYIALADDQVASYLRAPKIKIIHDWLKDQVENGLKHGEITPSFIRRWCLIDGKQTNLNTIKKYLEEFVKISEYAPLKDKPKTEKEKQLASLKDDMQTLEEEIQSKADILEELDDERDEINSRLSEIEEEEAAAESESENLQAQLIELMEQLEELQSEEVEDAGDEDQETEEDDDEVIDDEVDDEDDAWPDPKDIDVSAVKEGKQWKVSATVNGEVFEMWVSGKKETAIEELRNYYKKEIQ